MAAQVVRGIGAMIQHDALAAPEPLSILGQGGFSTHRAMTPTDSTSKSIKAMIRL
jgi:hypothetical protein